MCHSWWLSSYSIFKHFSFLICIFSEIWCIIKYLQVTRSKQIQIKTHNSKKLFIFLLVLQVASVLTTNPDLWIRSSMHCKPHHHNNPSHLHFVCISLYHRTPPTNYTYFPSSNHFPPFSHHSLPLFSKLITDVWWGCAQRPCCSGCRPYAFHTVMKAPGFTERMRAKEKEGRDLTPFKYNAEKYSVVRRGPFTACLVSKTELAV